MFNSFFNNETINDVIKNYLKRNLKNYGDIVYAYSIMKKKNPAEYCAISNYPEEWAKIYKENDYQYIDPVVMKALNNFLPFSWTEKIMISSSLKLRKVFGIAKKYKIISGYTFILHDCNNNLAMLSILIDDAKENTLEEKIGKNKDKLQMLLLNTHNKLISLYKEMNGENIYQKIKSKEEIFSHRENEILYWSSMGKTYSEIAIILSLKLGTIKFHMGNIVKKLGVLNGKHAIRLGVELKLIKSIIT